MARTSYYCAATLDGFIADTEDGIDWLQGFDGSYEGSNEPVGDAMNAFIDGVGSLVMGSATYDFLVREASAWPYGDRPTWVLSSRELPAIEGADLRFHSGPVEDVHGAMVQAAGDRDLWIVGGGEVANQFAERDLLDEVIVTVVPVILGEGKGLFAKALPRPMALLGMRAFANGMVELRYEVRRPV